MKFSKTNSPGWYEVWVSPDISITVGTNGRACGWDAFVQHVNGSDMSFPRGRTRREAIDIALRAANAAWPEECNNG